MADSPDNKLVDRRVAHRYVRKGIVDEKEYDRYLKSLPDLADQAQPVEASLDLDDAADELDDVAGEPPEETPGGGTPPQA
jgi:hypothetical protein